LLTLLSGVRIVHTPTGLAVKCTQERTQMLNRAIAMDMLRAKLLVVLEEQQAKQVRTSVIPLSLLRWWGGGGRVIRC
jgi:protein subunit release factor A